MLSDAWPSPSFSRVQPVDAPSVRQSADFPTHFRYRGLVYKLKVSRLGPEQYRVTLSRRNIEVHVERLGTVERSLTCFGRRYRVLSLVDGPDAM